MKILYKFNIIEEKTIEVTKFTKDESGNEIKALVPEQVKETRTFVLKQPNRVMYDDAELFYDSIYSALVKNGVLTKYQLNKLSKISQESEDKEDKEINDLLNEGADLYQEKTNLDKKEDKTAEDNTALAGINARIKYIENKLNRVQTERQSLYENSAEVRARNKTILYWILLLTHELKDNKYISFFGDGDYTDKIKKYDDFIENNTEFFNKLILKLNLLISFWYAGKARKPEEFEAIDKTYGQ